MSKYFLFIILFSFFNVSAADLNWSGQYRIESVLLNNSNLADKGKKSFFNHHLVLRPQMIAADGLTVRAKFDIFNNSNTGSQLGEYFGNDNSSVNSAATGKLPAESLLVNELYLSWTSGYGSLIAGRAPVQFGLGMTHNAGVGEFDHWFDVKDLIGYKVVFGNFYVLPMMGKVREGKNNFGDDINDLMIQFMYENLDSDLSLGVFYQSRSSSALGNDLDPSTSPYGTAATRDGSLSLSDFNIYVSKNFGVFSLALETGYQTGDTGLKNGTEGIQVEGFALSADLNYKPSESKFSWNLKAGSVSGDDPNSVKYEGYFLDRNYDVAMMLFNYSMGQGDVLGSNGAKGLDTNSDVDVEFLTNAIYVSPAMQWKWGDKWGMNSRLTYAMLSREQATGQGKNLGFEIDAGVFYKPHERLLFQVDLGALFPGDAFKFGASNFDTKTALGMITKAAVTF